MKEAISTWHQHKPRRITCLLYLQMPCSPRLSLAGEVTFLNISKPTLTATSQSTNVSLVASVITTSPIANFGRTKQACSSLKGLHEMVVNGLQPKLFYDAINNRPVSAREILGTDFKRLKTHLCIVSEAACVIRGYDGVNGLTIEVSAI